MGNTIKNIGGVAKEYVTQLFNEASLLKGIQRKYSDQFAEDGAKIGNVLNVKYMDNQPVKRGRQMKESSLVERTIPIEILDIHQYQTALSFNSADYALSVDSFCEKTNLKQNARSMVNEMEIDCARLCMKFNNRVGTLGTTPGTNGGAGYLVSTAPQIFNKAGAVMTAMGSPEGDRTMLLTPDASGNSMSALAGLLNPAGTISAQYRRGRMGAETLGFDFIENVNLPTFTTGTRSQAGGVVAVSSKDGDAVIIMSGLGANATIADGEHFTIAGVNAVNPLSQTQQGFLMSFVVVGNTTADASGNAVVTISPAISLSNREDMIGVSMVRRFPSLPVNVNGNVDALPLAGAVVTFDGAASVTGVFNCGMHRDAIVMTSVDLPIYGKAEDCHQEHYEGFSARFWKDADIKADALYRRIDAIVVFTMIQQQLGVVVWG